MTADSWRPLCDQLADWLDGPHRARLADTLAARGSAREALAPLRHMMRTHVWTVAGRAWPMTAGIHAADRRTRLDGFHALHDWDGIADHVNAEIIPVDVLDFVSRMRPLAPAGRNAMAVLIDYYFFHLLGLLSLRIWDNDSPTAAIHELGDLLALLQGPDGSGQPFVCDAATLLLIATSHYEPDERGYSGLLTRVTALPLADQQSVALGHVASLGAHLRFGFLATYDRQTSAMRDDNVADYPWLRWAVDVALHTVTAMSPADRAAPPGRQWTEALFGGLTADTDALLDDPRLSAALSPILPSLMPAFQALEPGTGAYSPLAFCFNFSHNVIKGFVVDAVFRDDPWTVSYNDLLTGEAGGRSPLAARAALARTLMEYARRSPQRIRGELLPVVVYDVDAGRSRHAATMSRLASLIR